MYQIYWHGKLLRSYEDEETANNSFTWFKGFLIHEKLQLVKRV